jgi:hypothetical protein
VQRSGQAAQEGLAPGQVVAAFGTCASMRQILGRSVSGCAENTAYRLLTPNPRPTIGLPPGSWDNSLGLQPGMSLTFPTAPTALRLIAPVGALTLSPEEMASLGGQVWLPLEALHGAIPDTAALLLTSRFDHGTVQRVTDRLAVEAPTAEVTYPFYDFAALNQDRIFEGTLNVSLTLGVLLSVSAFLAASLDRAFERRRHVTSLLIAGVSRRMLRGAQAIQIALPMAVGTVLAVTCGQLAEQGYLYSGGRMLPWDVGSAALMLLVGILLTVVVAGSATLAVSGRIDPELVRRE